MYRGIIVTMLMFAAGCAGEDGSSTLASGSVNHSSDDIRDTVSPSTVYEHDFGLVRPGEIVEHVLRIFNPSDEPWTIREVKTQCGCTVPRASSSVVQPKGDITVTLAYKAPSSASDQRKVVVVQFTEREVPHVSLVVRAKVRAPLTLIPNELSFGQVAAGSTPESQFEVHNFGSELWSGIEVETDETWLDADAVSVPVADRSGAELRPSQVWRITVRALPQSLASGKYGATLHVVAKAALGELRSVVPVRMAVQPSVVAIPEQFFFGTVSAGSNVSQSVLIRFAPNTVPNPHKFSVEHDLGEELTVKWHPLNDSNWTLDATLHPRRGRDYVDGTVTIHTQHLPQQGLRIPVKAAVEQ